MKIPKKLLSAFRAEKRFLIATHIDPDGDTIGSALALSTALESMGKETFVYCRDPVPRYYRFMPGQEKISSGLGNMMKADPALVLLDCNSPQRAAVEQYKFRTSIVIDHHETEMDFGDIRWVDHNAPAAGLMVYFIIKALGVKFTGDIASDLYAAISVDTGTFRYSNTSAEVLRACAELIESGAKPNLIADCLYETWGSKRFKLLVMTLNTLEIKDKVATIHVTREMFRKTGTRSEDTENFSNFPRMIKSVKISTLLRELGKGEWKASMRSRGGVNVAKIAELFGGGGHKNAAGFRIKSDLKSAKKELLKAIRKVISGKVRG